MKLSLNWLKNYVTLDRPEAEIERALTLIGFEVEGVERLGLPPLDKVVVGEILSSEQHPNADRLSVTTVDVGEEVPRQIVCGAKNYKVGDRVPVALPGAVLPGDFKIKKGNLRGVRSDGMMCSTKELGMGEDHAGLMILDQRPPIGQPINDVYPDTDTIIDLEVTPNRPDCLSHMGVARELAAYFNAQLDYPDVQAAPSDPFHDARPHVVQSIAVEVPGNCPHYRGYSIRGVKVGTSPEWLQTALRSIGLRPINNVVDVTNYVLHELGQPLHAFDAAKIRGNRIIVRMATTGEKITTLDEKERTLDSGMMVIADTERALVVAGVMGSVDAEVDESTRDILLESAYFNPSSIRRTSRKLTLSTDSSYRFERGVDPQGAEYAALRAIDLIIETAGGELCGPPILVGDPLQVSREILLECEYVRRMAGFHISDADIRDVLQRLELDVSEINDAAPLRFNVGIPSWRVDLDRPIDLVEEVIRIHGTEKIPAADVVSRTPVGGDDPIAIFMRKAGQLLAAKGFAECVNYPMRGEKELRMWSSHTVADALALANPLASDQSHLRTSIIPGLLDTVHLNQARGNDVRRLFEIGRVFRESDGQVYEYISVAFVMLDPLEQEWRKTADSDYYAASSLLLELLGLAGTRIAPDRLVAMEGENAWQGGHSAKLVLPGCEGRCGLLNIQLTEKWDIRGPVYSGALWVLPELLLRSTERPRFRPISQQPPATRDIAVLAPDAEPVGTVQGALAEVAAAAAGEGYALESVRLFDIYRGAGLPEGKKSLAFTLAFRSPERTLTDKEVNTTFESVQLAIAKRGYSVRA